MGSLRSKKGAVSCTGRNGRFPKGLFLRRAQFRCLDDSFYPFYSVLVERRFCRQALLNNRIVRSQSGLSCGESTLHGRSLFDLEQLLLPLRGQRGDSWHVTTNLRVTEVVTFDTRTSMSFGTQPLRANNVTGIHRDGDMLVLTIIHAAQPPLWKRRSALGGDLVDAGRGWPKCSNTARRSSQVLAKSSRGKEEVMRVSDRHAWLYTLFARRSLLASADTRQTLR